MANAGLLQEPVLQYAAPVGHYSDSHLAHGYQSQDILRTHGGTVSHISKSVVSPHSSVTKSVKTVNNEGYKTLAYAAPSVHYSAPVAYAHHEPAYVKTVASPVSYAHHEPAYVKTVAAPLAYAQHAPQHLSYAHHQPAHVSYAHQQPAVVSTYSQHGYSQPAYAQHAYAQPAYAYSAKPVVHSQPLLKTYAAPAHYESQHYAPAHYNTVSAYHQPLVKSVSPVVEAHSTKTLSYSPASAVSHFSYESPIAHYGW